MKQLCRWLSIIQRHSNIYYHKHFEELGISSGQYMFVLCICDEPGLTQEQIADSLAMNKSTVTRALAQLESDDFIIKKPNEKDKRSYKVFPTDKAKKSYCQIMKSLYSWEDVLIKGFTEDEQEMLHNMLMRVAKNVLKPSEYDKNI